LSFCKKKPLKGVLELFLNLSYSKEVLKCHFILEIEFPTKNQI
jgi:hypothetical protein